MAGFRIGKCVGYIGDVRGGDTNVKLRPLTPREIHERSGPYYYNSALYL